jgi:hypothetical protein
MIVGLTERLVIGIELSDANLATDSTLANLSSAIPLVVPLVALLIVGQA